MIRLPAGMPNRNYETLDAIAVVGTLALVGMIVAGLFLVKVDPAVAPIIASLGTGLLSIPAMYGAYRWGNNVGAKAATEAAAKVSEKSAEALAQLAGAGPPPPAAPLSDDPEPAVDLAPDAVYAEDEEDPTPPDEAALARPLGAT